jgi:hypothetical protein
MVDSGEELVALGYTEVPLTEVDGNLERIENVQSSPISSLFITASADSTIKEKATLAKNST